MPATQNVSYAGERLLKISDVCERTSMSRSTIYNMIASGTFPSPISITPSMSRWLASDLDKWIACLRGNAA